MLWRQPTNTGGLDCSLGRPTCVVGQSLQYITKPPTCNTAMPATFLPQLMLSSWEMHLSHSQLQLSDTIPNSYTCPTLPTVAHTHQMDILLSKTHFYYRLNMGTFTSLFTEQLTPCKTPVHRWAHISRPYLP